MVKRISTHKNHEMNEQERASFEQFIRQAGNSVLLHKIIDDATAEGGVVDEYCGTEFVTDEHGNRKNLGYDWKRMPGDIGETLTDYQGEKIDNAFLFGGLLLKASSTGRAIAHVHAAYMAKGYKALSDKITDEEILDAISERIKNDPKDYKGDAYDLLMRKTKDILKQAFPEEYTSIHSYRAVEELIIASFIYRLHGRVKDDGSIMTDEEYEDINCPLTSSISVPAWKERLCNRKWYKESPIPSQVALSIAYSHTCHRISRLVKVKDMGAPAIIIRNEYRMLVESCYKIFIPHLGIDISFPEVYDYDFEGNELITFNSYEMEEDYWDEEGIPRVPDELPRTIPGENGEMGDPITYVWDHITDESGRWLELNEDYCRILADRVKND